MHMHTVSLTHLVMIIVHAFSNTCTTALNVLMTRTTNDSRTHTRTTTRSPPRLQEEAHHKGATCKHRALT